MKIKNDLVSIKIGNKKYDFNNFILDELLNKYAKAQLDNNVINSFATDRRMQYCLLKFDTPFKNIQNDTVLHNQDFDICFIKGCTYSQIVGEKQIITEYSYDTDIIWDYTKKTSNIDISEYWGKKITAIGFNNYWPSDNGFTYKFNVCAVLDTSNYNIYLQKGQDFSATRRDIITTDALFFSSNKNMVPGPAHLAPYGVPQIINQPNIYNSEGNACHIYNDEAYGKIHSIGLSSYSDYIDKEFVIGEDIEVEENGCELIIKGIENYLSNDSSLFCDEKLYPSSNLYSIQSNYKYIILKYKVWQMVHSGIYDNVITTVTDTGYYYYQAIPIDKFGKINLKIKYERG